MEEKYVRPKKKTGLKLQAKARKARVEARKEEPAKVAVLRARRRRQEASRRLSSQLLPDGLTPALRARLSAAHRRAETDPAKVALLERAKLVKRVQLAKREANIPDADKPMKFMGMDPKEFESVVEDCVLPKAMTEFRKTSVDKTKQKPAPKVPRKSKK